MQPESEVGEPTTSQAKSGKRRNARWLLLINTLIVTGGALGSRVLGLVREAAINGRFGQPSPLLDTYLTAFRLPDLLYIVISGGALASTLIPVFQQVEQDEGEARAWQVVSAVVNLVLLTLLFAGLVIVVIADPLSRWWFAGKPSDQQQLLAQLWRVFLLSSPLLLGLGGIAMAVLNARERFGWASAAFNLYNLAIIGGAVWLAPRYGIWGVASGVVIGALLYLLIMLPGLRQERARYTPRLGLRDPAVRRIGRQLLPRLVGQGAAQIGLLATAFFAARLPNNQYASLNSANQLMLLPHGVFVVSLATVMFPQMARLWSSNDRPAFAATAWRTLRLIIFVAAPVAVLLAVLRFPVVRVLFERDAFDAQATALVAAPLLVFCTALLGYAASELLVRTFYAMQDTRTPVYVGVAMILAQIVIGYGVVTWTSWGIVGLAWAFSLANNVEAVVLWALLRRRLGSAADGGRPWLGIAVATLAAGAAVWALRAVSVRWLPALTVSGAYGRGADALPLLVWLAGAGAVGVGVYVGVAWMWRVPEVAQAWALVRRRSTDRHR